MNKSNKFLTLVITVILCAFLFTACDNAENNNDGGDNVSTQIENAYAMNLNYALTSTPINGEINKFVNEAFELTCVFSGNIDDDQMNETEWESSDESVVSVEVAGGCGKTALVNSNKVGMATVTATGYDGKVAVSVDIIVSDFIISSTVERLDFSLQEGINSVELNVSVPENREVEYTSTKPTVVKVDNKGLVTPIGEGEANVIVSEPKSKAKLIIPILVTGKVIAPVSEVIEVILNGNNSVELNSLFICKYDNLTYGTSDSSVVKLNDNGIASAIKTGDAKVSASITIEGVAYKAEIKVKVVENLISEYVVTSEADESYVNFYGRNYFDDVKKSVMFPYGASGFEVKFYGTALYANLSAVISGGVNSEDNQPLMQVLVDGERVPEDDLKARIIRLKKETDNEVTVIDDLIEGVHTVKVLKRTAYVRGQSIISEVGLKSFKTNDGGYIMKPNEKPSLKIDLYGDSLSCAYGNLANVYNQGGMTNENTNALLGYHYLAAQELNAQINIQAHSGWGIYINSSGDDTWGQWYNSYDKIAYGKSTTWDFNRFKADIVVINLGSGDSAGVMYGTYKSSEFIKYYKEMIDGLLNVYGDDTRFVLCYGMINRDETVDRDIESVAANYGDKVQYLRLDNNGIITGEYSTNHPSQENHKKSSEILVEFIKENFKY